MKNDKTRTSNPEVDGDGEKKNLLSGVRDSGPLLTSGLQIAAAIIVMFFIGRWLDERWHTTPWVMVGAMVFGCVAGMVQFIRTVNEVSKGEKKFQ